ncbi:UDP-3-O-(3-hydroxymyristoyl)glucosamine N-acyltransferase [Calycomorphotria hydatis]|uniref:UDP-3-O-acylglucosamine N-acyltransferase n=1 Tax=Calycomorphotria hydatis TaxID=2528027 RepID=A0A517T7N7_9PLAN|nr:UDP-3-O-(3-hydroxymyristoyl)glucosamine N-acyltransferase [Calycomorphotria hydatis]QDT64387.1 UDP-3-O-acylglucosamine N-acyltransferase [Calycomorphotria hydatis]
MPEHTLDALLSDLDFTSNDNLAIPITGAAGWSDAGAGQVTFLADRQLLQNPCSPEVAAIITTETLADALHANGTSPAVVIANDPKAFFMQLVERIYPAKPRSAMGISQDAWVHASSEIGSDTNIYPGATVSEHVTIGQGCDIHPGVRIGPGCTIGDNVCIHPNAVVYANCIIGDRTIVHANAVIGADGFGFEFRNGRHEKLPHYGIVRIEEDVEIGACSTIDRAMLGETVISAGTKIDNQVIVAHNCRIGPHNLLAGQVGIAGSSTTGSYVVCAGGVGIADHTKVGDGAVIASGSGVHRDIPAGETWGGYPAYPADEAKRLVLSQRKIPEMRAQLKRLEAQIEKLTTQVESSEDNLSAA